MSLERIFGSLQTRLLSAARMACGPDWAQHGRTVHTDPFSRLYWVHDGEGAVTLEGDGRVFHLRPGRPFVFPAHTRGRYVCPQRMDLTWMHFTAEVLGGLEPFTALGWERVVRPADVDATERRCARILALSPWTDGAARLEADGLLRTLLAPFAARGEATDRIAEVARFEPVFAYMEHHLDRPLRLETLAALVHLQPTYFSNRFARTVGLPPMRYLQRLRIRRAEGLLRESDRTLEAIARATGFCDAFHFSKAFKRHTGLAPSRYRPRERLETAPPPAREADTSPQAPR
ncbi:MAG: helix-turn-helix domain-containing protein [Planctomycetota bacterium]